MNLKKLIIFALLPLFLTACPTKTPPPLLNDFRSLTIASSRQLGHDFLALQQDNFKVKQAVKYVPQGTSTGHLDITFGSKTNKVKTLLNAIRPFYHRIHIINATCIRNGVCQPYEIGAGYSISSFEQAVLKKEPKIIAPLKARVQIYKTLSVDYPETKFLLSPILEHDLTPNAWKVLADAVLSVWPGIQLVNSPNMGKPALPYQGAWIERHGKNPGNVQGSSLDGEEGSDINVPDWMKRTKEEKYTLFWSRVYNCRTNGTVFIPPKERNACPSAGLFEEFAHIFDSRKPKPNFQGGQACNSIVPFDAPRTWKPLADMHFEGESRANYPVAIVPYTTGTLEALALTGKKVGTLGYAGTYDAISGYHRYYSKYAGGSGYQGYEFEKKADAEGSPWIWLRSGNKCTGPFVPGRRAGTYR